jgi:hypothetical protein
MSDKLSAAQTAVLDLAALGHRLKGVAVGANAAENTVSLSTARSLVKRGYLVEGEGQIFSLAEEEEVVETNDALIRSLARRLKARVWGKTSFAPEEALQRNSRGMIALLSQREQKPGSGTVYTGTVSAKVKRARRAKGKVAKASRRANRG